MIRRCDPIKWPAQGFRNPPFVPLVVSSIEQGTEKNITLARILKLFYSNKMKCSIYSALTCITTDHYIKPRAQQSTGNRLIAIALASTFLSPEKWIRSGLIIWLVIWERKKKKRERGWAKCFRSLCFAVQRERSIVRYHTNG